MKSVIFKHLYQERNSRIVLGFVAAFGSAMTLSAVSSSASPPNPKYRIETIAGNGEPGDTPQQGGNGRDVPVDLPFGVEYGPDGALYITAVGSHQVLRLEQTSGKITSVAGNGRQGYSGDGGSATEAMLNEPYEIRFDSHGNMLIVEMRNHLIRRIDAKSGIISTVAGDGVAGYRGDNEPALRARFRNPHSMILDKHDNIYISDLSNHRVRCIDAKTHRIETLVGNGKREFPRDGGLAKDQPLLTPQGIAIHGNNLWIASFKGHMVWRLDLKTGRIHRVAGTGKQGHTGDGGDPLNATFDGPRGMTMTASGMLYVVEGENNIIREIDTVGRSIQTIAGAGPKRHRYAGDGVPAIAAPLWQPHGLCVSKDGSLVLSDTRNHRVRRLVPAENQQVVFPGKTWEFKKPSELRLDGKKLDQFVTRVKGVGCIVKDGYIVKTWGNQKSKADWASAMKPVMSTMLLFAVKEGKLKSVDAPVRPYVRKVYRGKDLVEKDRTMTFRHFADMVSGYGLPEKPGVAWAYNDYAINLYSKTLFDGVFNQTPNDVATAPGRLGALQFQDGSIFGSRGGYGLNTTPRDFARIGWFWLNRGTWNGKQLLPKEYFDEYMKPGVPRDLPKTKGGNRDYLKAHFTGGGTDQTPYGPGIYGFNWWFNAKVGTSDKLTWPDAPADTFQANGHWRREVMTIIPSLKLVVAARGNWGDFQPGRVDGESNQILRLLRDAVRD